MIAGGILADGATNYFLAAVIGLLSHYFLDTIPHWEYSIGSYKQLAQSHDFQLSKKGLRIDSIKIGLDGLLGFLLLLLFISGFKTHFWPSVIGGVFGVLPDFFQFLYWIFPNPILKAHYDFHLNIHSKIKPSPLAGILTQIATVAVILAYFFLR